jgi:hypothetical protein
MNWRGKIVGVTLTAVFFLFVCPVVVGAQPFGIGSKPVAQKSRQQILSSSNGRFVFGQISDSSKDKFMLDTATGRLWRIGETGAVGMFLKSVPYRDDEGTCSILPEPVKDSKTEKKKGKK